MGKTLKEKEEKVRYIYSSFKLCVNKLNTGPPLNTTLSNLQMDLNTFCNMFNGMLVELKMEIKVMVLVKTEYKRFMGRANAPFEMMICKPSAAAVLVVISKGRIYSMLRSGGVKEVLKYVVLWKDFCLASIFLFGCITKGSLNMLYGSLKSVGLVLVYE